MLGFDDPAARISGRLSNVFLPRLVGIGPDKLAALAKSMAELSACSYTCRLLPEPANPLRRFLPANRQTLAVAYAQDFSITRNETTR